MTAIAAPAHGFIALASQYIRGSLVGRHIEDEGAVYLIDDVGRAECDVCAAIWKLSIIWHVERIGPRHDNGSA